MWQDVDPRSLYVGRTLFVIRQSADPYKENIREKKILKTRMKKQRLEIQLEGLHADRWFRVSRKGGRLVSYKPTRVAYDFSLTDDRIEPEEKKEPEQTKQKTNWYSVWIEG